MSNKFWNISQTISYNALFNFILGIRGAGKTYSSLKYFIERYQKYGHKFLYLRRTEEELKKLTTCRNGRIFNLVKNEFPNNTLWAESNNLYCDKEIMGWAQALTTAGKLKSDAIDNVRDIIFDEFIIDKNISKQRYLPDEVTAFLELYETIARPGERDYDVRCWFLGNAITSTNPYFDYFDINLPYNTDIAKKGEFLTQMVAPPELIEAKHATRFYKAIEGSAYSAYASENKFLRDNKYFIKKKNKNCEYQFTFIYYDNKIGVWRDYRNGCYFISDSVDKQCKTVYATTTESQQPNILLLKGFKTSYNLKNLKTAYELGCVYYENQRLASWFRDIVRMGL